MNGPQDLGGAMGFGRVEPDADDAPFHAEWERRVFALTLAMGASGQWNLDMSRAARESLPPARYLSSSYYEIWHAALERLMLERGLVSAQELADGVPHGPARPSGRVLAVADVPAVLAKGAPTERPASAPARFAVGDPVLAKVMHPAGHTRLPRYVRGRCGVVIALHGAHVYPDAHAAGMGEQPCWLYTVRFEARELWGEDTTADAICVDCWEPYLLPAPTDPPVVTGQ